MKVIVLGASGFIGFPVAQALSRAGHEVYGQTRSIGKSRQFEMEEIIPFVSDPVEGDWVKLVPTLDVVIDAIGGTSSELAPAIFTTVLHAVSKYRPAGSLKLTFIQTSGTWVHGENRSDVVTDTTPLTAPVPLVKWRVAEEQRVVSESTIHGIVIRPSMVYGKSGSLISLLFEEALAAKKEHRKMTFGGQRGGRFSLVHADDLADAYVRAAEKAPLIRGMIFDVTNEFTESVDDVLTHLTELVGVDGYEYREPVNDLEVGIAATTLIRPYLARSVLGWSPRKPGLVDGMQTYLRASVGRIHS